MIKHCSLLFLLPQIEPKLSGQSLNLHFMFPMMLSCWRLLWKVLCTRCESSRFPQQPVWTLCGRRIRTEQMRERKRPLWWLRRRLQVLKTHPKPTAPHQEIWIHSLKEDIFYPLLYKHCISLSQRLLKQLWAIFCSDSVSNNLRGCC